jgi:hypothetical protein
MCRGLLMGAAGCTTPSRLPTGSGRWLGNACLWPGSPAGHLPRRPPTAGGFSPDGLTVLVAASPGLAIYRRDSLD